MPWFLVALAALLAFWFALCRCVERYEEHLWRTVAFVARRIAPYRYLSLHLLAGLAVCFGAVFAFGSLAEEILETLNRHATPLGADALSAITRLGDTWVIAVGFSRVYLGVHYFSDVVGGYLSGIAWLAVCASAIEIARRHARTGARDI